MSKRLLTKEQEFLEIKGRVLKAKIEGRTPEQEDVYNLAVCHMNGYGTKRDTSAAVLLLSSIERGRDTLENVSGSKVYIDKACKNTPFTGDVIISIIDSMSAGDRIRRDRSHIIGDLVEVSREVLLLSDLAKIYKTIATIDGVDQKNSVSCKRIGAFLLEKLFDKKLIKEQGLSFKGYDPESDSLVFSRKEQKESKSTKGKYAVLNEEPQEPPRTESGAVDVDEEGVVKITLSQIEDTMSPKGPSASGFKMTSSERVAKEIDARSTSSI